MNNAHFSQSNTVTFRTKALVALLAGVMAVVTSFSGVHAQPTSPPTLANCSIRFHTTDEDKDYDTHVTVEVRDDRNVVICRSDNDYGHFDDNSNAGPYGIPVRNASSRASVVRGRVMIHIDPNGHDEWHFNFDLDLGFSDGSHLSGGAQGLNLDHNRREQTFGLEGMLH